MADFIFNVAKGKLKYYLELPASNDAIQVIPLLASGIISDASMKDIHDVGTVLSGATDENTSMGRKTMASVTSTVDDSGDKWVGDAADVTWSGATGGAIAALLVMYNPDTTASGQGSTNDTNCIPLAKYDFSITPNGGDITAQLNASGLFDAA